MLTLNKNYLLLTVALFVIEVLIALYVHDDFIRPYIGDVFVVILIYCFVKSFLKIAVVPAAIAVVFFAFCIETLQYYNFVSLLGLENFKPAKIVLGNSFEWFDILAYLAGFMLILIAETMSSILKNTKNIV